MTTRTAGVIAILLLAACAPERDAAIVDEARYAPEVPRAAWVAAPSGCEDVRDAELTLARVEGEPFLGALVSEDGLVRCVDALALLAHERDLSLFIAPRAGDPSPQPARPPASERAYASDHLIGVPVVQPEPVPPAGRPMFWPGYGDPTPTPVIRQDPTPTPVTED